MAYDKSKNEVLDERVVEGSSTCYAVTLNSYNGGDPKVQISQFEWEEEDRKYLKLKRMPVEDARDVARAILDLTSSKEADNASE